MKEFSVFVTIGGRVNPTLAASVNATKSQVKGLEATLAGVAARINAPFIAVQKHIETAGKQMERLHRLGRNMSLGVTMPVGFGAVTVVRKANERAKAANTMEAIGGISHDQRREVEAEADRQASLLGPALDCVFRKNGTAVSPIEGQQFR